MIFDIDVFQGELKLKVQSISNYESFESVFLNLLNKHTPLKKKFVRGNQATYMTKQLRKAIMRLSELESKFLKIALLKIELNSKNKRVFVANFITKNENSSVMI